VAVAASPGKTWQRKKGPPAGRGEAPRDVSFAVLRATRAGQAAGCPPVGTPTGPRRPDVGGPGHVSIYLCGTRVDCVATHCHRP
jgi:hypothetical protein